MRTEPNVVSNITEQISRGNLADVINEIEVMEVNTDTLLKVADSFNRRLKKLDGQLLPRVEKIAAQKLLMYLVQSCPTDDVFPYMFHVSTIYRHLLMKERVTLIEVGERLLELHDSWRIREGNDFTILRTNMYAYPWNFLREHHGSLKSGESLKIVSQSLRWLIRQGDKSFSNASHKMHQMSHIVTACEDFGPVEKFIKQLVYDARAMWLEDRMPQAWEQNAVQFDGVFNFTVCAIRYALYFKETEKAKQIWKEILESFGMYFDPDAAAVLEKACQYFFVFASYLSNQNGIREAESNEEDVMVIASQISKLVENSKIPGARLMLSYGFLQGICSLLQSLMREPRTWSYNDKSREFDRLISALFKLNYIMHTALPHIDLPHLGQKRRDLEASTYYIIFRLVSEFINTQKEGTFTMKLVVEKCFDGLKRLITSENYSKEYLNDFYNKINLYGGHIGSALVRVRDFDGGVKMMNLATDLMGKLETEKGCDCGMYEPSHMIYLKADACNQSRNFEAGLQSLAESLFKNQCIMESNRQPKSIDVLEPLSWYNWSYHWISLKKNAMSSDSRHVVCKTVADFLLNNKNYTTVLMRDNKKLLLRMLRFEFDSYFAVKSVIADGLIGVGEAIETHGSDAVDQSIGLLAQGIGFWWGEGVQLDDSISLFKDALSLMEKEAEKCSDNPCILLSSALSHAWFALGNLRKFQEAAVAELEVIKNYEALRNPKKFNGVDDERLTSRVVPAVSSLSLEEEFLLATHLCKAVSVFSDVISMYSEDQLRTLMDKIGSAVTITTLKLVMSVLSAMGAKEVTLRCCYVLKQFAEMYNRTNTLVVALSEIMKACPSMEPALSQRLLKLKENIMSRQGPNAIRNQSVYAVYFMRIPIARAVSCFRTKRYQEALAHLVEILEYRRAADAFDMGHHVLGEAYFLLAELKLLEEDKKLDLGEIPKYLRVITPVGLVSKGYKILASVGRTPQPVESGWNDLFHNYDLLATIMDVSDKAIKHYVLCGKLKEARCIAADFVYFSQQMALVSRTIDLVVPLAELDCKSRNFDSCQQKVDCVLSMLRGYISGAESQLKPADSKKVLETGKKLQISKEFIKVLIEEDKESWEINPVSLPEHTFGVYGPPPSKINDSPTILEPRRMKRIPYLHHPLNCICYVCTHPKIIPAVIKFYCLQARLAACAKKSLISGKILETANRCHLKAMLRILNSWDELKNNLANFCTTTEASEILLVFYKDFFLQPAITSQMTKMEMMPAMDLKESIPCYNQILETLKISGNDASVHTSLALEVICSAIFHAGFDGSSEHIRLGDIREVLEEVEEQEEFAGAQSPEPSKEIPSTYMKLNPKRVRGLFSESEDDDENFPEKEVLDASLTRKRLPLPFKLDDVDDDDDEDDDSQGPEGDAKLNDDGDDSVVIISQTGPSRNTRSRRHTKAK